MRKKYTILLLVQFNNLSIAIAIAARELASNKKPVVPGFIIFLNKNIVSLYF
jgi:hypothetical protein